MLRSLHSQMPFDFNSYSALLLPAFIQGVLFSGLFFYRGWKEQILSDQLMGLLLLLNSFKVASWMLGFAGWYDSHDRYTTFMFYFPFNNIIWMGPLLYFYFLSLTNTDFKIERKHWKHFILPLFWLLLIALKLIIDYLFYSPFPVEEQSQFGTKGPFAELDKSDWAGLISYSLFFYYLLKTNHAYKKYQQYVKENFSAIEDIRFGWLKNILYAISAGVSMIFCINLIAFFSKNGTSYTFDWYAYLFLGIITYYISIAGYFIQPRFLQRLHFGLSVQNQNINLEQEKDTTPELNAWKEKLVHYVEANKPYLQPDLTLSELAKQLSTNATILSKVINDGTGRNFNDFINTYRVQEVINKLKAGEQATQTLLGIAFDAGFNSKATFNRAFKKVTANSPKEWLQNNLPH